MLIKKKRKREKCPHQKLDNNHYKIYMKPLHCEGLFYTRPETHFVRGNPQPLFLKSLVFILK
jgi:hypothetical protein